MIKRSNWEIEKIELMKEAQAAAIAKGLGKGVGTAVDVAKGVWNAGKGAVNTVKGLGQAFMQGYRGQPNQQQVAAVIPVVTNVINQLKPFSMNPDISNIINNLVAIQNKMNQPVQQQQPQSVGNAPVAPAVAPVQ
ncbi:MAG: hypothetical protein AABY32_02200 [Nanoarchaeota archaeon]